jgi:hypothetical protein
MITGQNHSSAVDRRVVDSAKVGLLRLTLLVAFALAVTFWGVSVVTGTRGFEFARFISLVALFAVASGYFIMTRLSGGLETFFEIPVFMTLMAFFEFGLAPISSFLDPKAMDPVLHGDTSVMQPALQVVLVGMAAFWLGATIARSSKQSAAAADPASLPGAEPRFLTLALGVCTYMVGLFAKVYMLRSGMFEYLVSENVIRTRLAELQVWIVLEHMGFFALLLFAIEKYRHEGDRLRAALFWAAISSESFWGFLSGMKGKLLWNFVAIALVATMTGRKLKARWLILAVGGAIAVYPLMNHYRSIVRMSHVDATTSLSAAADAMRGAAAETTRQQMSAREWVVSGWTSTLSRHDMLRSVAELMAFQDKSYLLQGNERLWMIPFYPFIPRFIWRDKPEEDYGRRFTSMLYGGRPAYSNSSPTMPGDLYVLHYGIPGVLVGMFLIGLAMQWLTNPVKLCPSKRNLFIYACVFFAVATWEDDFFSYTTGSIKTAFIVWVVAMIVYGPARGQLQKRSGAKVQSPKLESGEAALKAEG